MKTYEFDVVLTEIDAITDDLADAASRPAATTALQLPATASAWIHFDRDATSLEAAIQSAVAQVLSVGLKVAKVELDEKAAVSLGV